MRVCLARGMRRGDLASGCSDAPRSPWSFLEMPRLGTAQMLCHLVPKPHSLLGKSKYPVRSGISQPKEEGNQLPGSRDTSVHFQVWVLHQGMDAWHRCPSAPGEARSAALKTDAEGQGTEVRTVLALMVLEAPQQGRGPVEAELSLTSRSGMANS